MSPQKYEFDLKWRENTPSNPRNKTLSNHEKARGSKDPHDSLKSKETHSQSKATPLPPIRMCYSASHGPEGPPENATDLGQCQLIDKGLGGPLVSHLSKAEVDRGSSWFNRTRTSSTPLLLWCGTSPLVLNIGSIELQLVARQEHPMDTPIYMRGGAPKWDTPSHNTQTFILEL
jgi:hypothetical protein